MKTKHVPEPSIFASGDQGYGRDMTDAEIEAAIVAMHRNRVADSPNDADLTDKAPCMTESHEPMEDQASQDLEVIAHSHFSILVVSRYTHSFQA